MATAAATFVRPTKLFVGGLSQTTTTKDLRTHFVKYANVLDCVAMRNDDGRSRGFGYVTLDNFRAAEKCAAEPQKINGRLVDVKMATREPANSGGASPQKRKQKKPTTPSSDSFALGGLAADAFSLMSIGAPPGLSLPADAGLPSVRLPPPGLPPPPPPGFALEAAPASRSKADNHDSEDDMSTAASVTTPVTPTVDTDSDPETFSSSSSTTTGESTPTTSSEVARLHAEGNCKPCNFFAKGRCQKEADCAFCHLPHQKRKPTRQEKRDRHTAWLAKQAEKEKEEALQNALQARLADLDDFSDLSEGEEQASVSTPPPALLNLASYYSDASDDDEESQPRPALSRESLLAVRVAMQALKAF